MPSDDDAGDGYEPLEVPVGEATVRVEIDQETYEQLLEGYREHVEAAERYDRRPVQWDSYVHNYCSTEYIIEIDGEVVGDPLQEADR